MPEGPSIFMLRELVSPFVGLVIQHASGNSKTLDVPALVGQPLNSEYDWRVDVMSDIGALPARKLREVVAQARQYSFEFMEWKKTYVLRAHWQAHNQKICPRCMIPFKRAHLGISHRRSFFCEKCQRRYVDV